MKFTHRSLQYSGIIYTFLACYGDSSRLFFVSDKTGEIELFHFQEMVVYSKLGQALK